MTFFFVAVKVIIIGLCIGAALAVVYAVFVLVPLTIYLIPYGIWLGTSDPAAKERDVKKDGLLKSTRYATRVYKAWITHKKPVL